MKNKKTVFLGLGVLIVLIGLMGVVKNAGVLRTDIVPTNGTQVTVGSDRFEIGPREIVVSKAQRDAAGLIYWTDGQLGVVPTGNGEYDFYSGHSVNSAKTHGTLDNPIREVVTTSNPIHNLIRKSDYASGGPIYRDPMTDKLVKIYHAEHWLYPNGNPFHSWLGMAVSEDGGNAWNDLGTIINVEVPLEVLSDIGSGQYMVIGDYMYVYFHDFLNSTPVGVGTLAVARTPLSEISAAIQQGRAPVFAKYHNGTWTEPGLGGKSSPIVTSDPRGNWAYPTVSHNTHLNKYVMALFLGEWEDWRLYLSTSDNALDWSTPVLIDFEPKIGTELNRAVYQILVDDGPDPYKSDKDFYLYYLHSTTTDGWASANLMRKKITVLGAAPTPTLLPVIPVPGDYDGDGRMDDASWDSQPGIWTITESSSGQVRTTRWGSGEEPYRDLAVPGDYDGDGKTDLAVWRQGDGKWYVLKSSDGQYAITPWGSADAPYFDIPLPQDYDRDGKTDLVVGRKGDGKMYILRSSDGRYEMTPWTEAPTPIVTSTPIPTSVPTPTPSPTSTPTPIPSSELTPPPRTCQLSRGMCTSDAGCCSNSCQKRPGKIIGYCR